MRRHSSGLPERAQVTEREVRVAASRASYWACAPLGRLQRLRETPKPSDGVS